MTPTEEAEVLFPDVDVEVRDPDTGGTVEVVVREFRFAEGLKVRAQCRGLVAALGQWAAREDGEPEEYDAIIAANAEAWIRLIARAVDRPEEWVAALSDEDGSKLDVAMWEANGPFFVRRIMSAMRTQTIAGTLSELRGPSATSSPPATAAPNGKSPTASPKGRSKQPTAARSSAGSNSRAT